jgi:prepilin-type N-terminal cleavage/methylation domain-containing protein
MRRAFTLIELLVVIAIIAILAAILFPVFAQARTAALKTKALSNVKQLGTSCYLYLNDHDGQLPNLTWQDSFGPGYPISNPYGTAWNGSIAWPISLIQYHKNDTKRGNTYSILISPNDQTTPNFTKPDFRIMLEAVNWPGAENFGTDWRVNAKIFPLSFCANYHLSYSLALDGSGNWVATGYTGPRNISNVAAPSNTVLFTEYGQGIAGSYQSNVYSNYYCALGYGGVDRWKNGRRYDGGRMFVFTDTSARWVKDPVLIEDLQLTGNALQVAVREAYAKRNIFDIAERSQP